VTQQIIRRELPDWVEPAVVHGALWAQHENVVWLDAGPQAREGYSYLGVGSGAVIRGHDLDVLRSRISAPTSGMTVNGPFNLGYVGWLGYDLGRSTTGVSLSRDEHAPLSFVEVRAALEFDHAAHRVTLMTCSDHDAVALSTALTDTDARPLRDIQASAKAAPTWRHDDQSYAQMVEHCRDAIRRGDAYQLCLTNEISAPGTWDALAVYSRLREDNPSHHGAMLSIGGVHLLSSSPEVFLSLNRSGRLSTMPIKGTRPRGMDDEADTQLIRELLDSEKEQAENLMIVDLMRNDLSRVGELGTVAAENLLQVHSLPHVHQLVSTVSTQLRQGLSAVDAIEATFPAGSMTGAPKIAAMSILNELEAGPRGIYSGAFGWLGYDGACELAMVIRSLVIDDGGASIGTGGGITIDSNPQAEVAEMKLKAEPALRALGLA
jgi:para-aminobenzoate synthetase component 1